MNFIIDTNKKKVEITWDNIKEYRSIIEFLHNVEVTPSENVLNAPILREPIRHVENPSISWCYNNDGLTYSDKTIATIAKPITYTADMVSAKDITLNTDSVSITK